MFDWSHYFFFLYTATEEEWSLRPTCVTFVQLHMLHLWGVWIISKREVLTDTDLVRFVNNICEKWAFCVHRKSLWEKNKCVVFVFVQWNFPDLQRVWELQSCTGLITCIYSSSVSRSTMLHSHDHSKLLGWGGGSQQQQQQPQHRQWIEELKRQKTRGS